MLCIYEPLVSFCYGPEHAYKCHEAHFMPKKITYKKQIVTAFIAEFDVVTVMKADIHERREKPCAYKNNSPVPYPPLNKCTEVCL